MRTLEQALRSTSEALYGASVSMSFNRRAGGEPYWTVTVIGRGAFRRSSLTVCGRNPLAVLRAMLRDGTLTNYAVVESAVSRSSAVAEVEALAEAHGADSVSLHYYNPIPSFPNGWYGCYAHVGSYCVSSDGGPLELRAAVVSTLGHLRVAA